MTHLIVSREYPPAAYPAGGIGAYVHHIAELLAAAGETVHVLGQLWEGAPDRITRSHDGRLIIHRIPLDEPINNGPTSAEILRLLPSSDCPTQIFAWQAAAYIEHLLATEHIDIIEAQEWEAPLYFLQLRRTLGLGPDQRPPCIVHLHSPSAMIFEHNEWDTTFTDFLPLTRMEEFTIRNADALLCPSRYLAAQVATRFQLGPASVHIIRYPMGDTPVVERDAPAWSSPAVIYVGRLELRKGVVEWVDAAVSVAQLGTDCRFEFFGADTSLHGGFTGSVQDFLLTRIPSSMRTRFVFHGAKPRAEVRRALAQVSIAVVPSRWENLPFTCIEAMATGMPVLASPNGGMKELLRDVDDGAAGCGWISTGGLAAELADALEQALATTPERRRSMGAQAAAAVRRACSNESVLQQHLELRRTLVTHPAAVKTASQAQKVILLPAAFPLPLSAPVSIPETTSCIALMPTKDVFDETFPAIAASAFAADRNLAVLSPFVLEESRTPRLRTGPVPPNPLEATADDLQPGSVVRGDVFHQWHDVSPTLDPSHLWPILNAAGLHASTHPGLLVRVPAPVHGSKRRYSVMVLALGGSPRFTLQWLAGAPWSERFAWARRTFAHPQRILRRLLFRTASKPQSDHSHAVS